MNNCLRYTDKNLAIDKLASILLRERRDQLVGHFPRFKSFQRCERSVVEIHECKDPFM